MNLKRIVRITKRPEILSYTAGIIDGEGYVTISKAKGKYYNLLIAVSNSDIKLVNFLFRHFKGCKCAIPKHYNHRWVLTGSRAHNFLKYIKPYIVCKKKEIKLGMRFIEKKYSQKLSLSKQDYLYNKMRDLKHFRFNKG